MKIALIITAAGSSTRFGCNTKKEYLPLFHNNKQQTVLSSSAETFLSTGLFSSFVVTIPENHEQKAYEALTASPIVKEMLEEKNNLLRFSFTSGGKTRQDSVFCGLKKLKEMTAGNEPDVVLIHDGARPWVSEAVIKDVINTLVHSGAAVPGINATDTQKEVDSTGRITNHLKRERIFAVQTPQGFLFKPLFEAHQKASGDGTTYTDDTEIWGQYCGDVYISKGEIENRKITYKNDIQVSE